jgi:hypothetical protein
MITKKTRIVSDESGGPMVVECLAPITLKVGVPDGVLLVTLGADNHLDVEPGAKLVFSVDRITRISEEVA